MDIIFIRNLRVKTIIGIFDWERRIRQVVYINIEIAADAAKAARSDRIEDATDYKSITKAVIECVENSECRLIETLVEKVAEMIMSQFNVAWLRLTLNKKGAIRHAEDVGITIERGVKRANEKSNDDRVR